MRSAVLFALLVATAAPALAADVAADVAAAPAARRGAMLRDVNNLRLGAVSRVNSDGSAAIIFDSRMVTVPATTLSMVDGKLTTSLTKKEINSMK
ncbi:hypothetical protein FOY91_03395 [Sphingomonas solaris]|uniref:Uncharacterized protein n=2 Tax=Alterirhizorhabdus solaris TaxID=2529389 RepID=A0A558RBE8_9SPHN|nr:hypothetical protein FOY91_03395 [Sphingomonas solaris]